MEDVDDAEEEKELLEDKLRRLQKVNLVATITSLKMKLDRYFQMRISLCRLVPMLMVRPTLSSDIQRMEQEFAYGYLDGMVAFYVSITNEVGESSPFTDEEVDGWDDWWKYMTANFNAYTESLLDLNFMKNMKFFVCDRNH